MVEVVASRWTFRGLVWLQQTTRPMKQAFLQHCALSQQLKQIFESAVDNLKRSIAVSRSHNELLT